MFKKHINDLDIREIMSYDPKEGHFFIDKSRIALFDTHSVGLLEKDLINVLGFKRTKGLLFRHGWNRGQFDAKTVIEKYDYDNDFEWMLAGPKIHQMQGFGKAEVPKIQFDFSSGTFFAKGYWYDSYEAKEYVKHFGMSKYPVCSTMIGYASGFISHKFPEKVIFKEEKCQAMGDPYCICVGKTLKEWGNEIKDEIIYYNEINLKNPLDDAYQRIENQQKAFDLSTQVHRQLMQNVLKEQGIDDIVLTLQELLDVPVLIENADFTVVISSAGLDPELVLKYSATFSNMYMDKKSTPAFNHIIKTLTNENNPAEIVVSDRYGVGHRRIMAPISFNNDLFGYISVISEEESQYESHKLCLEKASWACALTLIQEKTTFEMEHRMLGKFLDELLSNSLDKANIMKQNRYMEYNLDSAGYVFQIKNKIEDVLNNEVIIQKFENHFKRQGYRFFITEKSGLVLLFISEIYLSEQKIEAESLGERLLKLIEEVDASSNYFVAISEQYSDITGIHDAFHQAQQVIDITQKQGIEQSIVTYEDLGIFRVLLQHGNPEFLDKFIEEKLGNLIRYDSENNTELIKTLYYYVTNENNMHKTAKKLNLSLSGFRYRLKRIIEVCGKDIDSSEVSFQLYFALKYLIITNKLRLD